MKKEERDLNLKKLFIMYIKKWWIILLTVFAGMILLGGFSKLSINNAYVQATRKVIITNSKEPGTEGIYETQNVMQRKYYENLLKSQMFMKELKNQLSFDIEIADLESMINVDYTEDTAIFQINVAGGEQNKVIEIADKLVDLSHEYMEQNLKITDFYFFILDSYETEINSNSNVVEGALVGAVVAFIGVIVVLFVIFICDKKIYDEDDIEYYLDLNCLGEVSKKNIESMQMIVSEIRIKYAMEKIIAICGFGQDQSYVINEMAQMLADTGKSVLYVSGSKNAQDLEGGQRYKIIKSNHEKLMTILEYDKDFDFNEINNIKNDFDFVLFDLSGTEEKHVKLNIAVWSDVAILVISEGKESVGKLIQNRDKFVHCGVKFKDTILIGR